MHTHSRCSHTSCVQHLEVSDMLLMHTQANKFSELAKVPAQRAARLVLNSMHTHWGKAGCVQLQLIRISLKLSVIGGKPLEATHWR